MSIESMTPSNHLILCHPPSPYGKFQTQNKAKDSVMSFRVPIHCPTSIISNIDSPGGTVDRKPPASAGDTETRVWALAREDSTCRRAIKPTHHHYRAPAAQLEPGLCNKRSHHSEKPVHCNKSSPCLPQLEKAGSQQQGPSATKNRSKFLKIEKMINDSDASASIFLIAPIHWPFILNYFIPDIMSFYQKYA